MDNRNFAIGILSVTATVLLVGLLLVTVLPERPAMGFASSAQGGDYNIVTGQYEESTEFIYVADAGTGRLIAYAYDINRNQIRVVSSLDLRRISGPGR